VAANAPAETASVPSGKPVLDTGNLEELSVVMSPDSLVGLIALFLQDGESQMREITACEKTGDLAGIARQAHMMVSCAGNLGAMHTSALAREVEQLCKSGQAGGLAAKLRDLHQAHAQSNTALMAWRDARYGTVSASA